MAIAYSYPTATPEIQDLLLGTEMAVQGGEDSPRTRTFTIDSISSLISAPLTAAINLKANITSPTFLGTPSLPTGTIGVTQTAGNSTTALATTNFVTTANNLKANIESPAFTGTVSGITKTMVGLSNVDNTTDLLKPISTATQTALNLKANIASPAFTGTVSGIDKTMVGLSNVDNTTDLLKPISTATQTALNLKANIASPTFTGVVTSPSFVKTGGTTSEFLKANGDVDNSVYGKIIIRSANQQGGGGSTSPLLMHSSLIPANSFTVGDFIQLRTVFSKNNTNAGGTVYVSINTTNSLSGAQQVAAYTFTNDLTTATLTRGWLMESGNIRGYYTNVSSINGIDPLNNSFLSSTATLSPSSPIWFLISVQFDSASDGYTFRGLNIIN